MEKQNVWPAPATAPRQQPQRWKVGFLVGAMLLAGLELARWASYRADSQPIYDWLFARPKLHEVQSSKPLFNWDTAPSFKQLHYSPCYTERGDFQCARLELPLDYWNGTTNDTLSLAVVRKAAIVPVTDPRYGGPVLINPGGPGGSGVDYLLEAWEMIRHILEPQSVDEPKAKFFDIVSFDPRGVQFTSPNVQCFADPGLDQGWQLRIMEEGILGASDATLGRLWSMATARSASCSLPQNSRKDVRPYVTTAHVARDMIELVERHGEWREAEAARLLLQQQRQNSTSRRTHTPPQVLKRLKYQPGEEKLLYRGGSYGTYLGLTFAAMYPDRVGRLVVDGVVDAYDYREVLWTDNLADTEKEVQQFYYHCARAGYPACALANVTGTTTPAGVEARVKRIVGSLLHNPLPVIGPNPEVITYSDARHLMFAGLYQPISSFPKIAGLLAGIEAGNGTLFAELLRPHHGLNCPIPNSAQSSSVALNAGIAGQDDGNMAISCTDGDDQGWVTKSQFADYWHHLAELSPTIGPMWATVRLYCIHYSVRPAYRFTGKWEANTSHPILLVGNTADPVTPVGNAHKMSKGFPGSVVLTQNSSGHCSGGTKSDCTASKLRAYFQTGKLPAEGTVCEPDELPFGEGDVEGKVMIDAESQDIERKYRKEHAAMLGSLGGMPAAALGGRLLV